MGNLKAVWQKLKNGEDITLDFVGDSITWGLSHCRPDETYVACVARRLAELFAAYTVRRYDGIAVDEMKPLALFEGPITVKQGGASTLDVIRNGVGGNTTLRAHNRIEDFTGTLANGKQPDVTFLMFGINDALRSDPVKYVTAEVFKENYRNLIHDIQRRNPATAIVLMVATYNDQTIEEHCRKTVELALEENLPYIDLHRLWMEHYDPAAEHFGQGNWLVGGTDACHPTPLAAKITADYIVTDFMRLLQDGEPRVVDMRVHPGDSAFLIDTGNTAVLYDSGFGFTGHRVAEKIKAYLGERQLDYIFLTHSHYDHALGSAYILQYWPRAQVVAGAYAAKIFAKDSAKTLMRDLDGKFARQCGVQEYEDKTEELRVDIPVTEGDTVVAGDVTFTVIELPGHTKCSVGYYCKEHRLLLGCETVGVWDGTGGVVPSYLVGYQMALDSIRKAQALEITSVLVPHFGLLEGDAAAEYLNKAEASATEVAEMILQLLKDGVSKEEIVERYKERYYHGHIQTVYPIDAMELNTGITVELIRRELLNTEEIKL